MARIFFTDAIGAATLHNAQIGYGSRFGNWVPMTKSIGSTANRDSDGSLSMFVRRTDYGASFELAMIPVRSIRPDLNAGMGDIEGTIGATPTSMLSGGPTAIVALAGSSGAPFPYGRNGFVAKHTSSGGGGNSFLVAGAVVGHVYQGQIAVYVPSSSTVTAPFVDWETGTSGTTTFTLDLTKRDQWQIATVTATATATSIALVLALGTTAGGILYSDLWSVIDLTDTSAGLRMVDIADRLIAWLMQGQRCNIDTGDAEANGYALCCLMPSTTPTLALSDRVNLEYTLTLSLLNLNGARMACHYSP